MHFHILRYIYRYLETIFELLIRFDDNDRVMGYIFLLEEKKEGNKKKLVAGAGFEPATSGL
jgi:hypothetical protein